MTALTALLGVIGRILSDAVARIFTDWRRDRALVKKGAAEADAKANAAAAEAERRAAAVQPKTDDEVIASLDRGEF